MPFSLDQNPQVRDIARNVMYAPLLNRSLDTIHRIALLDSYERICWIAVRRHPAHAGLSFVMVVVVDDRARNDPALRSAINRLMRNAGYIPESAEWRLEPVEYHDTAFRNRIPIMRWHRQQCVLVALQ